MPDSSLLPDGGPDSLDGWDLEGLLSGENVWLPEGLRPVAATLASLRAAPVRAELAGESAAKAAFRQIMLSGGSAPAWPSGGFRDARALIPPTRTADGEPRTPVRPRHSHRKPPRRGRWQPKALAVGAAAAVVIVGVAVAGVFSGAEGHPAQAGPGNASTSAQARHTGLSGLDGSATKDPAASRTATQSASGGQSSGSGAESGRGALCRQYWAFFSYPESPASWAGEQGRLRQLSDLAGGAGNVPEYCGAYQLGVVPSAPGSGPGDDKGSGPPAHGNPKGDSEPKPHGKGNGNSGNGNGNGNGKGGSKPGKGNQQ